MHNVIHTLNYYVENEANGRFDYARFDKNDLLLYIVSFENNELFNQISNFKFQIVSNQKMKIKIYSKNLAK
jgi:hypothetical protein